jgi:hypothetical protein
MGNNGALSRKADLASVGMTAKVEVHACCERFWNDFGRMHEENADGVSRCRADSFFKISSFVVVHII